MRDGKFKLICIAAAALAFTLVFLSGRKAPAEEQPVRHKEAVRLNETLTNALSDTSDLAGLDKRLLSYMGQWQLHGVSLAIMRNDSLLYAKGYGYADEGKEMEPSNIFRLASMSKLVTAVGIMVLEEHGMLSLKDTVFGERGILSEYTDAIKDRNYFKITVEDLLRHKGGFTTRAGDPMFSTRTIMLQNHLDKAPDHETLIRAMLKRRLSFVPGTSQYYSNFGYMLLSEVIEKVTGKDYEDFIREDVLKEAGCTDFHIAGNYYKDRRRNEVRYYVPSNELPVQEYNNSGREVERCYGGNDIKALAGAGAWVASAPEFARLVASIDGRPEVPDIISKESVRKMVEYVDDATYSLGWNDTKPSVGWSRTGTFSGTSALVHYFPDGECWVLITNTSTWKGPRLSQYHLSLFKELRAEYSGKLPRRDLFYSEPS